MTDVLPPGHPTAPNDRPCALCKHLDERILPTGFAYCWRFCTWRRFDGVVVDCSGAERADGQTSPFIMKLGDQK